MDRVYVCKREKSFFPPLILSADFMTFVGGLKHEKQTIPYLVVLRLCDSTSRKKQRRTIHSVSTDGSKKELGLKIVIERKRKKKKNKSSAIFRRCFFDSSFAALSSSSLKSRILVFFFESRNRTTANERQ